MAAKSWQVAMSVALPVCFLIGAAMNDWVSSAKSRDALLTRRVSQALGEWAPPPLSDAARRALEVERADILRDIARMETRLASR